MDYVAIIAMVSKGLTIVKALYDAGKDAYPAIKALADLTTAAEQGDVTDDMLAETEALLDGMIEEFNAPIEPTS